MEIKDDFYRVFDCCEDRSGDDFSLAFDCKLLSMKSDCIEETDECKKLVFQRQ